MGAVKDALIGDLEKVGRWATVLMDAQPPQQNQWDTAYDTYMAIAEAFDEFGDLGLVDWAADWATDFADAYGTRPWATSHPDDAYESRI